MAKTGVIVIDPGHGGNIEKGGSSANNAVSASGVLEKNIVLRMAFLVKDSLNRLALNDGHNLTVILTRDKDVNIGLADRAKIAKKSKANLFLSIHCNGFDKKVRGTETLVSPISSGNTNHAADVAFAQNIQDAVFQAILKHDPKAKNRGVKDQKLGVLNDLSLGNMPRSCLLEIEFIDVPAVDYLLNIGPDSLKVREDIANSIAKALVDSL